MNYIMLNYNKDITLDEIADMLHLNPSYFLKSLKLLTDLDLRNTSIP